MEMKDKQIEEVIDNYEKSLEQMKDEYERNIRNKA